MLLEVRDGWNYCSHPLLHIEVSQINTPEIALWWKIALSSSPLEFGFDHVACFGQWTVDRHDISRRFKCACAFRIALELLPLPLEEYT